jgi:hypothetical protein
MMMATAVSRRVSRQGLAAEITRAEAVAGAAAGVKVVGMGSCGVDYLASVAEYPRPDEKLRTEQLEVQLSGS